MKKILFLICMALVLFWVSLAPVKAAEDNTFKLNLSYMPVSRHWDRDKEYNEVHHGVGINMGVGEHYTVGVMRFRNSYGDMSTLLSLNKEIKCWSEICVGAGGGYAWGYKNHLNIPVAAWGTVRWKFIQIAVVPGSVSSLSFILPLN